MKQAVVSARGYTRSTAADTRHGEQAFRHYGLIGKNSFSTEGNEENEAD